MVSDRFEYDVVIVGAGPVGLALALSLARDPLCRQLSIAIIDASNLAPRHMNESFDARVVALSERVQSLLQTLDVWPYIQSQRCCPYRDMVVWDAEGTAQIEFNAADLRGQNLGVIVENALLHEALLQQVKRFSQVHIFSASKLKNFSYQPLDSARCRTDHGGLEAANSASCISDNRQLHLHCEGGLTLRTSLAIGADGAHSVLRKLAAMPVREWSYDHSAIVTTVELSGSHQFKAWQRFAEQGPLAFLPLTKHGDDSCFASIVWSLTSAYAQQVMALDDQAFCAALTKASERRLGEVIACEKRHVIALHQCHAKKYIQDNIALMGDAAHRIHPLAGQGVNLGFYDVEAMHAEISRACQRGIPLYHGAILRRYERARKSHNLVAMTAMEGLKRLYGADNLPLRWLRNSGMRWVNRQKMLKVLFMHGASGYLQP